nr:hypothetical protein [Tanacetum cinerariifolium]
MEVADGDDRYVVVHVVSGGGGNFCGGNEKKTVMMGNEDGEKKIKLIKGCFFISPACRRTHCNHTADDDLEVFFTNDLGLDWISSHDFQPYLQKLYSYTSGHLEISESAACLEKVSFSYTSGHVAVF